MKNIRRIKDLTGQKFGLLTVIGLKDTDTRKTYWICQCDCGNVKEVRSDSLISGAIKSCGCLKKKQDKINLTKKHQNKIKKQNEINLNKKHQHKMSGTRIYQEWQSMKKRCCNQNDPRYDRYGGRGITVCDEWKNSFEKFFEWAMDNGYQNDLTLDRIDNDGNYEPKNCRWATQKEQSRNRSSNIRIKIGNSTKTLIEWCEIFNLDYGKIRARYARNGFTGIDDLFN